ncbi:MAG: L,D-transpeptidase, partial [Anaerobutyricum hallii]|jgi:lipoprotein-anchoring transpeptidase ErfK/SrfK|uniref:L,D-transpeptidase n=1 Tax=Anaerobutyricum hallii TaxID=39488 RepID=UPI00242B9AF1
MNRTLIGENYQTPVKYWVRITWTGTGFHAAPWQSWGSWSPSYYKSRGSHGCINLSMGSAAKMYSITKYGEIVFMHY